MVRFIVYRREYMIGDSLFPYPSALKTCGGADDYISAMKILGGIYGLEVEKEEEICEAILSIQYEKEIDKCSNTENLGCTRFIKRMFKYYESAYLDDEDLFGCVVDYIIVEGESNLAYVCTPLVSLPNEEFKGTPEQYIYQRLIYQELVIS